MKARIAYEANFNPFGEGYAIYIQINGKWELASFFPLVNENMVNYSIINKIAELTELGYHITYL